MTPAVTVLQPENTGGPGLEVEKRNLILSILGRAKTLTVATLRDDGWPHATVVSFVNE